MRLMKRYLRCGPAAEAAELTSGARLSVNPGRSAGVSMPRLQAPRPRRVRRWIVSTKRRLARAGQASAEYSSPAVNPRRAAAYLHGVGERWAAGHMIIAQEHLASNFLHALFGLPTAGSRSWAARTLITISCTANTAASDV